jgi:hypothetical protein
VIHVNISKLIIHVRTIPRIDKLPTATNPASASPAVIIRTSAKPIPIPIQPRSNEQAGAETETAVRVCRVPIKRIQIGIAPNISRVILRNIDHIGLCRLDADDIVVRDHLLLVCALQITGRSSLLA